MAQLTEQNPVLTGIVPTYVAVAATDFFVPLKRGVGQKYLLHFKNAGASPDSVSINDPTSVLPAGATGPGATAFDVVVSVVNATEKMILLDNIERFVDPATGRVDIANSFITTVTCAVFAL